MDSTLVVCYSWTGTSRRLAQMLCAQKGWPLAEVVERQPRAGGSGYLRCVLDSLLRRSPPVHLRGPDPADFRTIVLVAPIWAGRMASPMRSFVREHAGLLGHAALVSTMGSRGAEGAVAELAALLGRPPIASAAFTEQEVRDGSCAARLQAFADSLVESRGAAAVPPARLSPAAG